MSSSSSGVSSAAARSCRGGHLDDSSFAHLYVPPGFLHGFQSLTEYSDTCYRIDREHDPAEDLSVRFDDPALGVDRPLPVEAISQKDLVAGTWGELVSRLHGEVRGQPQIV